MKKLIVLSIMVAAIGLLGTSAFAEDKTLSSSVSATVGTIFSLEFYTELNKVLYSTEIPFSVVDPSNEYNYANTRVENDGKSDVGLVVRTNHNVGWYLKLNVNGGSTLAGKLGAYMGQPYTRNVTPGVPTDGTRPFGDVWFDIPTTAAAIYNSGPSENITTPYGTLATLTFKINGAGLAPGRHEAIITYTATTTP